MPINIYQTAAEQYAVQQKTDAFNTQLEQTQKIVSKNELGEADFLKILITQLKTQDPTKPMDDKEFIGQMAQMTSLKQMNRLTDNMIKFTEGFNFTKAVALVDKNISYVDSLGALQLGKVESIKVKNGLAFLNVNGEEVGLDKITEVMTDAEAVNQAALKAQAEAAEKTAKPIPNASVNGEFEIEYPAQDVSQIPEGNAKVDAAEVTAGSQQ